MINRRYYSYKLNNTMKPYTYLIKHKPSGKVYYGFRSANKVNPYDDLWKQYFTSSPKVQHLIETTGVDSFDVEVRKIFETKEQASVWETKVLRRCKVLTDDRWINQNIAGYVVPTEESNRKISEFHKDKPKTKEHKQNLSKSQKGSKRPWSVKNLPTDTKGKNNGMFGKQHSDETKKLIGEKNRAAQLALGNDHPMRKIEWTPDLRKAMGDKSRGKKRPQHAIDAASAKLRGQKREKRHCPHCARDIAVGWYHRHGDHCSQRQ